MKAPPCTQTSARPDAGAAASRYSRAGTSLPCGTVDAVGRLDVSEAREAARSDAVSMSVRGSAGSPFSAATDRLRERQRAEVDGVLERLVMPAAALRIERADQVVLLAHEQQRVDLAELGEGVALPLARPVAAVAALDEDAHELGVVDGRLLAGLVDVVELRVHVQDLRHDVGPLLRRDVPVHVEREVGERSEASRVEVAALEVADELLLALLHRGIRRPDRLHPLDGRVIEPGRAPRAAVSATCCASSTRSPRRIRAAASRARRRSRAPSCTAGAFGPIGAWIS